MAVVLVASAAVSTIFAAVVALLTASIIRTTSMIERKPSITEKKVCTEAVIFCHAEPVPSRVSTKLETLSPIPWIPPHAVRTVLMLYTEVARHCV